MCLVTHKLMMFVNCGVRSSASILNSLAGIWSALVELSVRRLRNSWKTVFRFTGSISNASGLSGCVGMLSNSLCVQARQFHHEQCQQCVQLLQQSVYSTCLDQNLSFVGLDQARDE